MPFADLVSELRRVIRDTKPVMTALTVSVQDTAVTSATLELTDGRLILAVSGGTMRGFDLLLVGGLTDTVGKLHQHLQRYPSVAVEANAEMNEEHPTSDLEPFGPIDVRQQGAQLRHHVFSNWELDKILERAALRHNPSISPMAIPAAERELVLTLAQSLVLKIKAQDAVKRKGTDSDVATLLSLAADLETQYERDAKRLQRAIQAVPEAPNGTVGVGDVMTGNLWRRSARTGFKTPLGVAEGPPIVPLLEPDERDPEDTAARVRWTKAKVADFYAYELWMDTREETLRERETSQMAGFAIGGIQPRGADRVSSSKLVFRAFGPSANRQTMAFSTFIETQGQLITSFNVGELEPETDYFFRLYVKDLNFEETCSEVVRVRTKALRSKFDRDLTALPTTKNIGQTFTVTFDADWGTFSPTTHQVTLGGKVVVPVLVSGTTYTITVPSFFQVGSGKTKDLVVLSPNGLLDVWKDAVEVLS
jgi:hypothetical protein